jgi:hypothetical protein
MELTPPDIALLAAAGFASGWVNVVAGGGSLFNVAALIFLGLPGPAANGTNRIATIAQSIAAVAEFRRKGFHDFKLSASLAAAASLGAYVGARLGVRLEGDAFERVVALVMIAVGVLMAVGDGQRRTEPAPDAPARHLILGHVLMVGAGVWGGFIQIGVGFLIMPILYRVMGLGLVRVNMHKVFITLIFTMVALLVFASEVRLAWAAGAALACGNALGGWAGARAAMKRSASFIKIAVYLAIAVIVVKLVFF